MDPNFGRYWHFCGTIMAVTTNRNSYKGVPHRISDKDAVHRLDNILNGFIVKDILVPQNASELGFKRINVFLYAQNPVFS